MKAMVIYLTLFFIIASIIRAKLGIEYDSALFYKNPNLEKTLVKKEKKLLPNRVKVPKKGIKRETVITLSPLIETKLTPIEYKYLKKSLLAHLSSKWKHFKAAYYTLNVDIKKDDISKKRKLILKKGKKYYLLYQKSKIYISYELVANNGISVVKGYIPYKVIVKSASKMDYLDSLRLAKKRLFSRIGQLIANDLNKKFYYIQNYSNIAIK